MSWDDLLEIPVRDGDFWTLAEIADIADVCAEAVRMVEWNAMVKLRRKYRFRVLAEYLNPEPSSRIAHCVRRRPSMDYIEREGSWFGD